MASIGLALLLGFLLLVSANSTCTRIYEEGGASAVLQSSDCLPWLLIQNRQRLPRRTCKAAVSKGRKIYDEDRATCVLDIQIPLHGRGEDKNITLGVAAVFDGHNGAEASQMASELLLDYFLIHVEYLLHPPYTGPGGISSHFNPERLYPILLRNHEVLTAMGIIKESILRAIHDIDKTFSEEASRRALKSGATAAVVVIADRQILVANIGDSKAILCSESAVPPPNFMDKTWRLNMRRKRRGGKFMNNYLGEVDLNFHEHKYVHVKELSYDHHPDREDEKKRVEAAGGYIEIFGVPRVNGELAVSRSIGDLPFKSYGVISTPEITEWQAIGNNDTYIVVASDGIFDKLAPFDVCELLREARVLGNVETDLADYLVNAAFESGSMDNLGAVIVPIIQLD